jgi:hypothetical protein
VFFARLATIDRWRGSGQIAAMPRRLGKSAVLIVALAALCGCDGPHAFIREGTATSVQIEYSQNVEPTQALARGYCMRYEKVPMFVAADGQIAEYNCVPLPRQPMAR